MKLPTFFLSGLAAGFSGLSSGQRRMVNSSRSRAEAGVVEKSRRPLETWTSSISPSQPMPPSTSRPIANPPGTLFPWSGAAFFSSTCLPSTNSWTESSVMTAARWCQRSSQTGAAALKLPPRPARGLSPESSRRQHLVFLGHLRSWAGMLAHPRSHHPTVNLHWLPHFARFPLLPDTG